MSALALLFDQYASLSPEPGWWLDFEDGGAGHACCLRCIKKRDAGKNRYSGHGCASEEDSCLHCGDCGKLLDYTLTDAGAEYELDHFRTVKFRSNKSLDRETAYHLARLIAAKDNDLEVTRIAARAIRCMKRIPALTTGKGTQL